MTTAALISGYPINIKHGADQDELRAHALFLSKKS
jgi:hypothetical protein